MKCVSSLSFFLHLVFFIPHLPPFIAHDDRPIYFIAIHRFINRHGGNTVADLHQTVSIFKEYHPDTANTGVTQPDVSAENGKNLIRNTGNKDCTFRATYMVADTGTYYTTTFLFICALHPILVHIIQLL